MNEALTEQSIQKLLQNPALLQKKADSICREHYGSTVFLRGLVEFSSYCVQDCLYCGIRKSNTEAGRYRLDADTILDVVKQGFERGLRTFVLQSGEDPYYTPEILCSIVDSIKKATGGEAALTLSCGILNRKTYAMLRDAGADRYLLRFETADPSLHKYLRQGHTLEKRLEALRNLRDLGFETGSGFMTGLPGETEQTLIDNILLCKDMQFDMVGIGPFIPHEATPLKDSVTPDLQKTLNAAALVRIALPLANLPATTAAGSLDPTGREQMLTWGANVLMPNISPVDCKQKYLLYPGKICLDESGFECIGCLGRRVATIDKTLVFERGDSLAHTRKS